MLVEKTTQLTMEVNEIKEDMLNKFGAELFDSLNGEEFEMIQKTFKLMDLSMEIIEEQSRTLEIINEKLDKLLTK